MGPQGGHGGLRPRVAGRLRRAPPAQPHLLRPGRHLRRPVRPDGRARGRRLLGDHRARRDRPARVQPGPTDGGSPPVALDRGAAPDVHLTGLARLLERDADDRLLPGVDRAPREPVHGVLRRARVPQRGGVPRRPLPLPAPDHGRRRADDPRRLPDREAAHLLPRPPLQRVARDRRAAGRAVDGRARLPAGGHVRQPGAHLQATVAGDEPGHAGGAARGGHRPRGRHLPPGGRGGARLLPRDDR